MSYIVGTTQVKFPHYEPPVTVRYVFSTEEHMILYAQALNNGLYHTLAEELVVEVEAFVLGNEASQTAVEYSEQLPEWAIARFIEINVIHQGRQYSFPLSEMEADVNSEMLKPVSERNGFLSEMILGLTEAVKQAYGTTDGLKIIAHESATEVLEIPLSLIESDAKADAALTDPEAKIGFSPAVAHGIVELLKQLIWNAHQNMHPKN